jgi:hypothetical protein
LFSENNCGSDESVGKVLAQLMYNLHVDRLTFQTLKTALENVVRGDFCIHFLVIRKEEKNVA